MVTDVVNETEQRPPSNEDVTSLATDANNNNDAKTSTGPKSGEDQKRKQVLEQLAEKLEYFYETKVQESLGRKAECEDLVYNVVHKIIRKVQTVDTRFRANSLVSLGMPYDGIHSDDMTEFEMMLQLSLGHDNSLYLLRDRGGKSARIQPTSASLWQDCMDENSVYVSPKRITRTLRQYVKRAVYVLRKYIETKKFDKLPEGLNHLELETDERFQIYIRINKVFRVLLLPSVSIPDYRTDMSRKDIPSSSHVVAMQLPNQKMDNEIDQNNNVPPPMLKKKNRNKNIKLVWKFSFFVAEKNKLRTISDGCRIRLLRILTELRDFEPGLNKLSSYHLQTMFFHEVDRLHRRRDWKDSKIGGRFIDLLRAVSTHLSNGVCTNYFMHPPDYPETNLFESMERKELQKMKQIIDGIIENPLVALKSVSNEEDDDDEANAIIDVSVQEE